MKVEVENSDLYLLIYKPFGLHIGVAFTGLPLANKSWDQGRKCFCNVDKTMLTVKESEEE